MKEMAIKDLRENFEMKEAHIERREEE